MPYPLTTSTLLFSVPAQSATDALALTPASYASWTACFTANPTIVRFNLGKGSYVSWGPIDLYNRAGGTADNYREVRYADTDASIHPCLRSAENQAYVDAVKISGPSSNYWIFQGLYINNASVNCGSQLEPHHVVFDFGVIEECGVYGMRMLATQYTYIQRMVIRDMVANTYPGDSIGVQYKNVDGLPDMETINNYLLDCEIYNCGDGYALTESNTTYLGMALRSDGVETYINSDQYVLDGGGANTNTTWRENGFDLKAGSDDYQTHISNWRAWGMRRNPSPATALGEIIVIQKYARNMLIEDGIGTDAPCGMKDENWPSTQQTFTVNAATDELTCVADHNLNTGAGPITVALTGTGALAAPLVALTPYWAIYVSDTVIKLAASRADALAGTAIDLTDAGSGTQRWRPKVGYTRNITLRRNQWARIKDYASTDAGQVYLPITDIAYEDEVVADCTYAFANSPTTYYDPTFTNITLRDVAALQRPEDQTPALPWIAEQNTVVPAPVYPVVYDVYQRKRWTGPEWAVCATVVTEEVAQPTVRTRTRLFVTPSPRRQATRYSASRKTGRR